MVRHRARIRFRKRGDLRFAGHRDLVRAMERLFRRAGLKLAMSEGFHPKPRMSFPSALALGIEGIDEVVELELAEEYAAAELAELVGRRAAPGLELTTIEVLPPGAKKAQLRSATYEVRVPAERRPDARRRISRLLGEATHACQRPRTGRSFDLRASIEELALEGEVLRMRLAAGRQASAGPRDVLAALELADLESAGLCLARTRVELA